MYVIRVSHPFARDSFIRRWGDSTIGVVQDKKDATRFDNKERALQVVQIIRTHGQIRLEGEDS